MFVPPVLRLIAFPDSTKTSWEGKKSQINVSNNYIFARNLHFFSTLFKSESIFQTNKQRYESGRLKVFETKIALESGPWV